MARSLPKFSGLVQAGKVVPASGESNLPDLPSVTQPQPLAPPERKRDLRELDITLIDANPLAPREIYTADMIRDRAEDLRKQGQHDPIHVIPNPDAPGRYIICDGWTRVQACLEHKVLARLLAEVHHNLSLDQAAWFGFEQNEGRAQHTDLDRALFFTKLINAGEQKSEIARRAKLSKTLMSFYMAYQKLPAEVLDVARQHPQKISANAAYQLARLYEHSGIRRTLSLALQFAEEDHPVRWLTNQVQLVLTPPETRPTTTAKTIRYSNGVYKQRGDQFELAITVSPDKRLSFAIELEKLIASVATEEKPVEESDAAPEGAQE